MTEKWLTAKIRGHGEKQCQSDVTLSSVQEIASLQVLFCKMGTQDTVQTQQALCDS